MLSSYYMICSTRAPLITRTFTEASTHWNLNFHYYEGLRIPKHHWTEESVIVTKYHQVFTMRYSSNGNYAELHKRMSSSEAPKVGA